MISAKRIRDAAASIQPDTVRNRRHLHMHPELSFEESETAAFVAAQLAEAGIPHTTGVGGHGVIGLIRGNGDRTVALRADMDALAIAEQNECEYRSRNPGVMHACGHDGHTTSLLGAARILADHRDELPGNVKLVFQPAEEKAPGGAIAMMEDGVLEDPPVESIVGQHVNPDLPAGTVGFRSGLFMGSVDDVYITVRGQGGHAAKPHQGVDPVAIAASIIVALQQIVSRNADPIAPSVLSFGYISGAGTNNIIPDTVDLAGTFRTFDPVWRDEAVRRIERAAVDVARALGGTADVRMARGYPSLSNDPALTERARQRAVEFLGEERVVDIPPALWGEDFAYYGQAVPGCFYNLGVRNEQRGITHSVHSPLFDLEESALEIGAGLMAWIAIGELEAT